MSAGRQQGAGKRVGAAALPTVGGAPASNKQTNPFSVPRRKTETFASMPENQMDLMAPKTELEMSDPKTQHQPRERGLGDCDPEPKLLQNILNHAPGGIGLVAGPELRWAYINDAYLRLTGRSSPADFLGKPAHEAMPKIAGQGFHQLIAGVYSSGKPYVGREMKAWVNCGAGGEPEEGYFDFVYQPVFDSAGKVEGVFIYADEVTEKVLARRAIEESAERLRLAQTAAQIGIWEWDPVCGVQNLSIDLHHIFGTSPEDPDRVDKWLSQIHPADRSRVQLLMYEGHRLGRMEFEYRYVHPEMGQRWLFCKGLRRPGETRMHGIVQDVTIRKMTEEAAQRLAAIVESSDDAIVGKDLNGIINSWNPGAERLFGYTADEIVGQSILRLIPEDIHWEEEMILSKIRSGQRVEHFETTRLHKNGSRINVSVRISPVKDGSGRVIGASKIVRDTSERRRRDELRFLLAAIVDSSEDAIASKDLNGIVTSWNRGAERIFGYTAEEMIGQSITKIIPPELYDDETRFLSTIAAGGCIDHFETVRVKKNGEPVEISLTISPIRDESGKIIGAAKIAREITQQKRAERAMLMTERLAAVGRLAATVAHEINNPLEAVTNLIFLARNAGDLESVSKYLSMAEEELERVSHLTKQTLGFYRETRGATGVRVGELVDSLLFVFTPRLRNRGITLVSEVNDDIEIQAVPGEIRQIIANLISNSIDALEAGGRLRIRVSSATQWDDVRRHGVRLTVADSGEGVPEEVRAHLFEPFFTTKKEVGTGLGLWICKSIIENHCGTIQVRSSTTPGKSGTAFSVFLPAAGQSQAEPLALLNKAS